MLPSPDLKPAYGRVVWLRAYRDFSRSDADRAAERVWLRFGLTGAPRLVLVHPGTLEVLGEAGSTPRSFLGAVERARVSPGASPGAAERLSKAEARAIALERPIGAEQARAALADPDIVVRTRAIQFLAQHDPAYVAARAEELLKVGSDPFRYEVCRALGKAGTPAAARTLEALLQDPPAGGRGPSGLKVEAIEALGACGDVASVAALKPIAATGDYRNGATGRAAGALAAIAARLPETRPAVRAILSNAYPVPPPPADEPATRACAYLARQVHEALGKVTGRSVPFPAVYDAAARERLRGAR